MNKIAIMGFGNPCRSDDAIGIYVAEKLQKIFSHDHLINVFDMGTGAFEILFKLKGHSKIILIDAVINSGERDGTLYKVPADEVMRAPVNNPMVFLHSLKWDQALSYAKQILQEDYPSDIQVYLIAVNDTKLQIKLSEVVKQAGDKVINLIREELYELVKQPSCPQ
jgi:hydrogenase maturation protease